MKSFAKPILGIVMSATLSLPAVAQQGSNAALLPGETAFEYATRVDACDGAAVQDAEFLANRTQIRVACPRRAAATDGADGMAGGLGGGAIAIAGGLLVAVLAISGGGGGSSSSPSTN